MPFPHPRYRNDPINALYYFDYDGLCHLVAALPDPVIARITNMADYRVRSSIFGAIPQERSPSVNALIEREQSADPEKDEIVRQTIVHTVTKLVAEKKIKYDGDYVVGVT
jgi:hypothetical protein